MSNSHVKSLGFETAAAVLASVSPESGMTAVDVDANVIWQSSPEPNRWLARAIHSAVPVSTDDALQTRGLGDRGVLAWTPIRNVQGETEAWLFSWSEDVVDVDDSSHEWKRLTETLPRVASMLSKELELAVELHGAVDELAERYEELNLVYSIEREVREGNPRADIVRAMFDNFVKHMGVDVGVFIAKASEFEHATRGTDREIANADLVLTELRGKLWRFVSAGGKPVVMNDVDDDRRAFLLTHMPFKLLAIPNEGCGASDAGLLLIRHIEAPDFTNSDMSLARVFFGQAMMLIRQQGLMAKMGRFTRQIASSLVEAVEAKDPYTRGHSERVEQITGQLGLEAGIRQEDHPDLMWGALLHDIGKIGVPDAILMKPGRLTDDEYTFIKTHPDRSFDILRHIEQLGPVALDGARYHQEKFDGTGYPFGLAGHEIPLAARVVSIADTYDAVTSSRSYRAARSHEEALAIIRECAGEQLDPELVELFLRIVARGDRIGVSVEVPTGIDSHG